MDGGLSGAGVVCVVSWASSLAGGAGGEEGVCTAVSGWGTESAGVEAGAAAGLEAGSVADSGPDTESDEVGWASSVGLSLARLRGWDGGGGVPSAFRFAGARRVLGLAVAGGSASTISVPKATGSTVVTAATVIEVAVSTWTVTTGALPTITTSGVASASWSRLSSTSVT